MHPDGGVVAFLLVLVDRGDPGLPQVGAVGRYDLQDLPEDRWGDAQVSALVDLMEMGPEPATEGDGLLQALGERGGAEPRVDLAAGHHVPAGVGRVVDVAEVVLGIEELEGLALQPEGGAAGLERDLPMVRLEAPQQVGRRADLVVGLGVGLGASVVQRVVGELVSVL